MALDRLLVLAALGVAGVQRIAHPIQHLVVEVQPAQEFGELLLKHLLAHIFAAAGSRVALALIGMTGAVIVDVAFLLLDLADYRIAARPTFPTQRQGAGQMSTTRPMLGTEALKDTGGSTPDDSGNV